MINYYHIKHCFIEDNINYNNLITLDNSKTINYNLLSEICK